MNSLDIQVIHIICHITITKYKNFKIINLIHMIFILNSVFHCVIHDEMNKTRYHLHMF
jgi:hypothetical protein